MSDFETLRNQLQELSQVAPTDEMTSRAVAATREAISNATPARQIEQWKTALHPLGAAIATSAVLIAAAVVVLFLFNNSSPMVAYAEVVAQIEQTKTVQYLETRRNYSPRRKLRGPTEVNKVIVLGRSRERREIVSATKGDPLPDGSEWTMAPVGVVTISDCATGKYVGLNLKDKTFHVYQLKAAPAPEVDFYKRIREFPAEGAKRLPQRKIKEKNAAGFRTTKTVKRQRGVDTWIRTSWIDPSSNLPVQIEVKFVSTDPSMTQSEWVLSDIVFDEAIDATLLSTEPPEGYKVFNSDPSQ